MKPLLIETLPLSLVKEVDITVAFERLEKYRDDRHELAALWVKVGLPVPSQNVIEMNTGVMNAEEKHPDALTYGLSIYVFNEMASVIQYLWEDIPEDLAYGFDSAFGTATIFGNECVVGVNPAGALMLRLMKMVGIFGDEVQILAVERLERMRRERPDEYEKLEKWVDGLPEPTEG